MKKIAALVLSTTLASACLQKGPDESEARNALPGVEALSVKVPGTGSGAGGGAVTGPETAQIGQLATFYVATRQISGVLNGGAAFVLILVRTITLFPATSVQGDTLIWGPWSESLKPAEYRLTATHQLDGDWAWSFEGRKKGTTGAFSAVVNGLATPGAPGRGKGAFTIDFDVAKSLDPVSSGEGQIAVTYDLESNPRNVVMDYEHLVTQPDGSQQLGAFHYAYAESQTTGAGDFQFRAFGANSDPNLAWRNLLIRSRWLGTGTGRSDVTIAAGNNIALIYATANECWDTSFNRTYYTDSANYNPTEGDPASCAFSTARHVDQQ